MAKHKSLSLKTFPWRLTAALLLLTCCSFVISYSGLTAFAAAHQIDYPHLWPLIIDGTISVASVVALMSELAGRNGTGYYRCALLMTLMSVAVNVVHVLEGDTPWPVVTYVAHAIAPAMIFVLLDIVLRQAKHSAHAEPRVTVLAAPRNSRGAARTLTSQQAAALVQQHGSRRAAARAIGCAWRTLSNALKS